MKVTLIGPVYPYRGGISHHTTLLAQGLQKKHTVQVISFIRQYPKWLYPGKTDKDPSQLPIQIEAEYLLDPLNPISWLRTYHNVIKFCPDFVVIPWWTTFWAPADLFLSTLLKINKVSLFYIIHNVIPHEARKFDTFITRLCLKSADGFVVQSRQEQERLQKLLGQANIGYYPHPVYQPFVEQTMTKTEARKKLGIHEDRFVLLFFGIIRPYKGLKILLEAMNHLRLKEIQPILLVAGEIWGDPNEYYEMVERLGLSNQVIFFNRYILNEELPIFFCAADIFIAPYLNGTQSGAVKMALGYQLPVIATDAIIDQSILDEGDPNLSCVPSGDPSALAESIHSWMKTISQDKPQQPKHKYDPSWDGLVERIEYLMKVTDSFEK